MSSPLQLAQLGVGLAGYLREQPTLDQALAALRDRVDRREERFLDALRRLVYGQERSPHRRLLEWAGCELGDLEAAVMSEGLDHTLERLRDAGVYVSLDELKGRRPVERHGLSFAPHPSDFDNPTFMGRGIVGATSGTGAPRARAAIDLAALAEEAANELALYSMHGVAAAPLAIWLAPPPGLAGIRNVLVNARFGRAPERWFTPVLPTQAGATRTQRLATRGIVTACRLRGLRVPRPELAGPGSAVEVATWLARDKPRMLSTFASPAVRVAVAVAELGLDVRGAVVFSSGEPLTHRRRRTIEDAGLTVHSRYATTEAGLIAGACGLGFGADPTDVADPMHVYVDRVAVIAGGEPAADKTVPLLFTSLSPAAGKVLLNTSLGDRGRLERGPCSCLFGQLGMSLWTGAIRSDERLTGEGVALLLSEVDEIVARLIATAGGTQDDYQFRETVDETGLGSLVIAVSPDVPIDEGALVASLLESLRRSGPVGGLTAELWGGAAGVRVERERPQPTSGFKLPRYVRLNTP